MDLRGQQKTAALSPSNTKRRLKNRIITAVVYLGLLCADLLFSHWDVIFGREQCNLVNARLSYQRVVTLGYRKPKPHFVRPVTVTPPESPCEYRSLIADLVRRIGKKQPMMIVLDYSFSPHNCANETRDLQDSIDSVSSLRIPVKWSSCYGEEVRDRSEATLVPL